MSFLGHVMAYAWLHMSKFCNVMGEKVRKSDSDLNTARRIKKQEGRKKCKNANGSVLNEFAN